MACSKHCVKNGHHRIDARELYRMLDGVLIDDANVFNDKLKDWEDYYNYH